ncbi:inhibitor of growth protein 1 homolog [Juglans microcarpa x Juglans regia]|uniref:inhibitor of growth protein 1 homolog n=1 Tax=Juglans microcarpa x Juglans regia TaxID=2249226 RepID=UPI001B7F199C|nr:inhibitor of growth protein 1 homolog [Juglans microcarpa x Juglans regia]
MERCVDERALKSSLRGELPNKSTQQELSEEQLVKDSLSGSSSQEQAGDDGSNSTHFSGTTDSKSHLPSELAVPNDDFSELEWVSHFVDDSLSGFSLSYVVGKQKAETLTTNQSEQPENRPRPSSTTRQAIVVVVAMIEAATVANFSGMDLDLTVDPNEPTDCLCNQVSYGEMVDCDNPDCKIEFWVCWFERTTERKMEDESGVASFSRYKPCPSTA